MSSTFWAMALKPLIAIAFIAGLVYGARAIAWLLWWVIPDSRLKRELFRSKRTPEEEALAAGANPVQQGPLAGQTERRELPSRER